LTTQIKLFLKIDILAIVFGMLYFLTQQLLGSPINITNAAFAGIIFWVLSLLTAGFMGYFRSERN
jgi:hypothetical protein